MKGNIIKPSITFLAALFISVVIFFYLSASKNIFKNQAYSTVQKEALDKAANIEISVGYALSSIKLVSEFVSSKMTERELKNPNEVLSAFSSEIPFNFIEYIRWDGLNFMNSQIDGKPFDASQRDYYKNGVKGQTGIWINYAPKASKEILLNFYTPLYFNGEIAGVLTGAMGGKTTIQPRLDASFFGQKIFGFLCDENLEIISSTTDDLAPGTELYKYADAPIIKDVVAHAESNDPIPFRYNMNKKDGICCVAKVNSTNWHVVLFVYPRTLAASMKDITNGIILTSLIIICILLSYTIARLYIHKKENSIVEKTHINIINALSLVYRDVYVINSKTDAIFIYRTNEHIASNYSQSLPKINYEDGLSIYLTKEVYEEDRHLFNAISDTSKIAKIFETNSEYSFVYRIFRNNEIHYFQCDVMKPSENSDEFVVAFKNVDKIISKQLEDQKIMNNLIEMQTRQISILSSISGIYHTVHLVDLEKDIFAEFKTSREIRDIVTGVENAAKKIKDAMEITATPEYKEQILAFVNLKTIVSRLRNKKVISKEFVGLNYGWIRASFITVDVDKDGNPQRVLFLTQIIDSEKRKEESLSNAANRDELTGLLNRHAYESDLADFRNKKHDDNFVYISFDVNGLKAINDNLGHKAGDELIIGAADCIEKSFAPYGKVYRTGGDEFQSIIFADSKELEQIKNDFENIMMNWSGELVPELRISAGYVLKSEDKDLSISEMIKLADQRMYKAKSLFYSSKGIDRRAQQDAYEVLCNSYTKILKINLTNDEFSIIQMDVSEQDSLKGYNEKISKWLHDFGVSGQVHKDDIDEYLKKTDIEYLKDYFRKNSNVLAIHYRRKIQDTFCKVMMELLPAKNFSQENKELYLYVKNVET